MPAKLEYKGKDVDAAINEACKKLQVSRELLNIEVVSTGSAGIFGLGKKKAVIKATLKDAADTPEFVQNAAKPEQKSEAKKKSPRPVKPRIAPKKINALIEKADEALSKSPSPEVMNKIENILLDILSKMGYPSKASLSLNGNKIVAQISGEHLDALIGREGSILDALQYLMRKIISQQFPEKIFLSLDAGDYRAARRTELEAMALEIANSVKETGKSRTIAALNPAERRIVHVTLQDDETIRSSSIGEGLFKKIRIYLPGTGRKKAPRRSRSNRRRTQSEDAQA